MACYMLVKIVQLKEILMLIIITNISLFCLQVPNHRTEQELYNKKGIMLTSNLTTMGEI